MLRPLAVIQKQFVTPSNDGVHLPLKKEGGPRDKHGVTMQWVRQR
jgi:hypothetical protein